MGSDKTSCVLDLTNSTITSAVSIEWFRYEKTNVYVLSKVGRSSSCVQLFEASPDMGWYPWFRHERHRMLVNAIIILRKGVKIIDSDDCRCAYWFLNTGACIYSEDPNCLGDEANCCFATNDKTYSGKIKLGPMYIESDQNCCMIPSDMKYKALEWKKKHAMSSSQESWIANLASRLIEV